MDGSGPVDICQALSIERTHLLGLDSENPICAYTSDGTAGGKLKFVAETDIAADSSNNSHRRTCSFGDIHVTHTLFLSLFIVVLSMDQ